MTTLEESICLINWLREHREIGLDCMTGEGTYEHLPEFCKEETQDYWEWEQELRNLGPVGERNYALIRRAAKKAWAEMHGDQWTRGETMTRRTTELVNLSASRERVGR